MRPKPTRVFGRFSFGRTSVLPLDSRAQQTAAVRSGRISQEARIKPRNPIALIARQAAQQIIPDKRHAKKRRAQRKRDAQEQERRDG